LKTKVDLDEVSRLLAEGRAEEAFHRTAAWSAAPAPPHKVLAAHAGVLKALGRPEEALAVQTRIIGLYPASGVAWHNYAATLGDLERPDEARAAARRAFQSGLDAPETWLVYGRALLSLGDLDGAESAFRDALLRRPAMTEAALDLSRLIWLRTADADKACVALDQTAAFGVRDPRLTLAKVDLLHLAGRDADLRATLQTALEGGIDPAAMHLALARADLHAEALDSAATHAEAALDLNPQGIDALVQLAAIRLAQGRAAEALGAAREASRRRPEDQAALGHVATALRVMDDPEQSFLNDYDAYVRAYDIAPPRGWDSIEAYLAELAPALDRLLPYVAPLPGGSARDGIQTLHDLVRWSDPPVRAFFAAVDEPIRSYLEEIGQDAAHPVTRRNTGRYRIEEASAVRLWPDGRRVDHLQPKGWVSAVFYVQTPEAALDKPGREGWLRLGQPPFKTVPPLGAERQVRPRPGRLVLFPSYLWRGVEPFRTEEQRLTLAFNLLPRSVMRDA
jgi:tetratricopeptide (TPR) repeat protein